MAHCDCFMHLRNILTYLCETILQEVIRRMWSSAKAASTVSRHWSRLSHRRSPTAPRWTPADSSTVRPNGVIKRSSSTSAVVHHRSVGSGTVTSGSSEQHLGASVTFCSNAAASVVSSPYLKPDF